MSILACYFRTVSPGGVGVVFLYCLAISISSAFVRSKRKDEALQSTFIHSFFLSCVVLCLWWLDSLHQVSLGNVCKWPFEYQK